MAQKIQAIASLHDKETILDIGVGTGTQVAYWLHNNKNIKKIVAVEKEKTLARSLSDRFSNSTVVKVVCADASNLTPEDATSCEFDAIICLDCAYHFQSRRSFLYKVPQLLRRGGSFAAVDLVATSYTPWTLRWLAQLAVAVCSGIHCQNVVPANVYRADLIEAGLRDIVMEDISSEVFLPLSRFAWAGALDDGLDLGPRLFFLSLSSYFRLVSYFDLFRVMVVHCVEVR